MTKRSNEDEPTALDDLRRVREKIAEQHRGNITEHMKETNRIFDELRVKLGLKTVTPPPRPHKNSTGRLGHDYQLEQVPFARVSRPRLRKDIAVDVDVRCDGICISCG